MPDSKLVSADQSKKIIEFFRNAYISVRAVDRRIAEFAHELTNTHKLANMDAVHIATAVENRVPVLYTYDGMKGKRKGLIRHNGRIGKPGSSPLKICVPPNPLAGTLFELPDQEL